MGTCNAKSSDPDKSSSMAFFVTTTHFIVAINKNMFMFMYVIGKGGFGKVWKVEKKKERRMFAMKEMSKARILAKRSVNSVLNERKILSQLRHPYVLSFCTFFWGEAHGKKMTRNKHTKY